jgi:hypothetical protein
MHLDWFDIDAAVAQCRIKGSRRAVVENFIDLKFRPRSSPARPSLQLAPSLSHALAKAAVEARQQRRVFGQLHEALHDLRLHLLDQRRPPATSSWRGRRLTRLPGCPKALHDL